MAGAERFCWIIDMTRTAIKRACLEWLTIGLASMTVALLALWAVSATSTRMDFVLYTSPPGFVIPPQLSLSDGAITVSKDVLNPEDFDRWAAYGAYDAEAQPLSLDYPGLAIRRVRFGHSPTRWRLTFSLLFPMFACAALTASSFWLFRRTWRKWRAELTKAEAPPLG